MFKKNDNKSVVTEFSGMDEPKSLEVSKGELVSYITIQGTEKTISHPLGNKLTIGSEVGDLIVQLDGIGSRHCTVLKNENVYCFIDHGSEAGTFLNGKRLEAGKTFFYKEGDSLRFGPNTCRIETKTAMEREQASTNTVIDEVIPAENTEIRNFKELNVLLKQASIEDEAKARENEENTPLDDFDSIDVEEVYLDESFLKILKSRTKIQKNTKSNKSSKSKNNIKNRNGFTANSLLRLFSLSIEVLMGFVLVNVFYVFVDFKKFMDGIPKVISTFLLPLYESTLKEDVNRMMGSNEVLNSFVSEISLHPQLNSMISFVFLVWLIRLISTMIFGVSLGQKLIGLSLEKDSFILSRVKSFLREFIGILFFPFIIFDIPSLFGNRTFKEVLTNTRVISQSNFGSLVLGLIFTGLMSFALLLSPLIKGLDILHPVKIEKIGKKKKTWEYKRAAFSNALKLKYETAGSVITLPSFQIQIKNNKRFLTTGMTFLDKKSGKSIEIKKVKEFSMGSVLRDYIDLNYLSRIFEPELYSNIRDIGKKNDNFTKQKVTAGITEEIEDIYIGAYSLSLKSYPKHMINSGPIISGHRDFREKISGLIQTPFTGIKLIHFGEARGAYFLHELGDRDEFSFVPSYLPKSTVYNLSEDITSPKFSRLIHGISPAINAEELSHDFVDDFVSGFKKNIDFEDIELSQKVYERYFMLGKLFLEEDNDLGKRALEKNITKLLQVLKENKKKNIKLFLNLNEMYQALRVRNFQYFQVNQVRSV